MTREQLEHLIRAAADLSGDDELVIIGSQAILAAHPDAPDALRASMEADVYPLHHPERADVIDGTIGEGSPFHATFGYYAQGVGPETAILPDHWRGRCLPICNENTRGATGWALDPHDLAIAKYAAARPKDREFVRIAIAHGLFEESVLHERLAATSALPAERREAIAREIGADFATTKRI